MEEAAGGEGRPGPPQGDQTDSAAFLADVRAEAEAGSGDHQLFLGRHYTKLARAKQDPEANGMLGVDWLIKASRNGNQEATELLRDCLQEKIGITEDNVDVVQWCVRTSAQAKALRVAARRLYGQLGGGPEGCSKDDYVRKVQDLSAERREKKFLLSTANKVRSADTVVEDEFVDTVARRMQSGQIDPSQDDVELAAFNEAPITRKLVKYPGATVTMAVDGLVEFMTTDLVNLLMYVLPIDQLNLLIVFFLFSLLSFSWLFSIFSLTLYYLSFTVMVICTLQVFKNKRKQQEVKAMAVMLKRYCDDVDASRAEGEFMANSARPYWTFLASLGVFVPAFCLANKAWIPCSELALASTFLAGVAIVYLSKHDDPLVLTSLGFDALSCLPHLLAGFPEIPILSQLVWLLTTNFYSIRVLPRFFLNLSIPALEYAILPLLFARMAFKDRWRGIYKVLLPHLIGFFWLQIAVLYFDHSSWLGLARGSMGWVSFVLLMPFITLGGTVYGIYYSFVTFNYMSIMRVVITVFLLLTPVLLSVWQGYGYSMGSLSLRGKPLKVKIAVVVVPLVIIGAGFALMSGGEGEGGEELPLMPWELYRERCGRPAWEETNMADAQRACEHFRLMEVNWTGLVETVNITDIENPADSFLDNFPEEIAEWLKCLYGVPYAPCNEETQSEVEFKLCELRAAHGRQCHMKDKRTYTFKLTVTMPLADGESQSIPIRADDEFKDLLFQLKRGDVVEYQAILMKHLGTAQPVLKLGGIKCKECHMLTLTEAHAAPTTDPLKQVRRALLESISFFTSPLLEYRPPPARHQRKAVTLDIPEATP